MKNDHESTWLTIDRLILIFKDNYNRRKRSTK